MSRKIYLDFNASTPICPEAVEAMRPFLFKHYGNPSSLHWAGMPAKDAVEKARGQVAALLGCDPTEVVFSSFEAGGGSGTHDVVGFRGIGIATRQEALLQPLSPGYLVRPHATGDE